MMARAKRIDNLMIKVNRLFSFIFFVVEFSKRNGSIMPIGTPYLIKRTAKRASIQAGYFPFDINGFNLRATYQSVYCGKVKKWKTNNYLKLSSEIF